jgi:arylsulfatase A-like enzyme
MSASLILAAATAIVADGRTAESPQAETVAEDVTPNIIVFLVDDLGWQDSGVAFSGNQTAFQRHFRTPWLQRLAERGVRLTQAYAHCVCSPTRTSILTGQNPARHRVTNWTLYPDKDQSGRTARLSAPAGWRKEGLQPDAATLPNCLREAGYRTIHCGKAHWGAVGTHGSDPRNLGFDVNIAGHAAGAPGSYQGQQNFGNLPDGSAKPPWGVPGLEKYHGTNTHLTDALAAEASAAVEAAIDDGKPFFLYMAPYAVHTPIQSHPRFIRHYREQVYAGTDIDIPAVEADYASMVEGYDAALGMILTTITRRNVADRTIILFTSDNGGLSVHSRGTTPRGTGKNTHCWPLREGKGSAYEGGTRVPMIVAWATPDSGSSLQQRFPFPRNALSDEMAISEDIFPTVCRWAGVNVPDTAESPVDGVDLNARLAGSDSSSRGPLLFHYPHVWGPAGEGYQPHSALRDERWKVIYFYDDRRWELYDLQTDIGENRDLSSSRPQQLQIMQARLRQQLSEHGAQYPTVIASGQPEPPG